jgi:zinc protease
LQASVAGTLASNWLLGLPPEFLAGYVPRIRQVTAAEVQAIGRKYFDPKDHSIVVVGDGAAIAEQLRAYGEFQPAQ